MLEHRPRKHNTGYVGSLRFGRIFFVFKLFIFPFFNILTYFLHKEEGSRVIEEGFILG